MVENKDTSKLKSGLKKIGVILTFISVILLIFSFIESGIGAGVATFEIPADEPFRLRLSGGDHVYFKLSQEEFPDSSIPDNIQVNYVIISEDDVILSDRLTQANESFTYHVPWYASSKTLLIDCNLNETIYLKAGYSNTNLKEMTSTLGIILFVAGMGLISAFFLFGRMKIDN